MRALLKHRLRYASLEDLDVICDLIVRDGSDLLQHSILRTGSRWSMLKPCPWQSNGSIGGTVGFTSSCLCVTLTFLTQVELARQATRVCKYWNRVTVQSPQLWRTWTVKRYPPTRDVYYDKQPLVDDSPKGLQPYLLPAESLPFVQRIDMNGMDPFALLPSIADVHEITNAQVTDLERRFTAKEMAHKVGSRTLAWRSLQMTVVANRSNDTVLPPMPLIECLDVHFTSSDNPYPLLRLKLPSRRLKSLRLCWGYQRLHSSDSVLPILVIDSIIDNDLTTASNLTISVPMVKRRTDSWLLTDLCFTINTLTLQTNCWDNDFPMWNVLTSSAATLTRLVVCCSNDPRITPFTQKTELVTLSRLWTFIHQSCTNLEHLEIHPLLETSSAVSGSPTTIRQGWPFASTLRVLTLRPYPHIAEWLPVDALTALETLTLLRFPGSHEEKQKEVMAKLRARGVNVVFE